MRILCQNITIVCLVCAGWVIVTAQVDAADIMVDAKCNLADAIRSANWDTEVRECRAGIGPDTIHLTEHVTLTETLPPIRSQITIEGKDHTVSGDNQFRIFYVTDGGLLTINRLTVIDAQANFGGAIVLDDWTALQIKSSVFAGNRAGGGDLSYGGAIYSRENATLVITRSRFIDNAALDGGAIYTDGDSTITGSSFRGNSASGGDYSTGGALVNRGSLTMFDSVFEDNTAASYAGALSNFGRLSIIDGKFSGNSAGGGGALVNSDGDVDILDSEFIDNAATLSVAGAISNNGGTIDIWNSTIRGNATPVTGGGLMVGYGRATLNGVTLDNNSAAEGGGIFVYGDERNKAELHLRNSSISNSSGGDCVVDGILAEYVDNTLEDDGCIRRSLVIPAFDSLVDRLVNSFQAQDRATDEK